MDKCHHFHEDVKVQRFCLTLLGEARLWFHSIEPLGNTTWPQLQNLFRHRYSKLDNTHEQLFHVWRSFNFNENTETIDSYVTQIRQVATLLDYGEPQVMEVFKNTLPTKLYWILFPIEDLRQTVETAKGILNTEKLDKQLTGQNSASPFMNIRDTTERKVSFNTRDELGDKIDKLTVVMSRKAAKDSHEKRPFKPQIYKSRGQNRSYNWESFRTGQIVGIGDSTHVVGLDKAIETVIFKETLEDTEDKIIEARTGQEKGHLQEIIVVTEIEAQVIVDLGLVLEQV